MNGHRASGKIQHPLTTRTLSKAWTEGAASVTGFLPFRDGSWSRCLEEGRGRWWGEVGGKVYWATTVKQTKLPKREGSQVGEFQWEATSCFLLVFSLVEREKKPDLAPTRAGILTRAPPPRPHLTLKSSQRPHLINTIKLGVWLQHTNLGGQETFGP